MDLQCLDHIHFVVPDLARAKAICGKCGLATQCLGDALDRAEQDFRGVVLANEVFTPSDEAVTEAREILAAMEQAKKDGAGATVYKGRLVDIASIKQAEVIVRQSEMIAG